MDKISLMFKALRVEERVHTLGSGYVTSLGAEVPFFPCGSPGLLLAAFAVCLQGWWGAAFEDPRCGRRARGFSLVFLHRFCSRIRLLCPPNPPVCSPAQGLECQRSVPVPCPAPAAHTANAAGCSSGMFPYLLFCPYKPGDCSYIRTAVGLIVVPSTCT